LVALLLVLIETLSNDAIEGYLAFELEHSIEVQQNVPFVVQLQQYGYDEHVHLHHP